MRNALLIATLVASTLPSQQLIDSFSYPDGPVPPIWVARTGSWVIRSGRLAATSGALWAYITHIGPQPVNSVLDGEFFYGTTPGVQFGGLTSRNQGLNTDSMTVMCKIQDNGGTADLDSVWLYERGGTGATVTSPVAPPTQSAYCRMITLDNNVWFHVDANKDGIFEQVVGPKALTTMLGTGYVGMNAYQSTEMDNFEYFDAVLMPDPSSSPRIGTSYKVDMTAPLTQMTPSLAMLSLGNAGIPLGGGRAIPLSLDPMFSLGLTLAGPLGLVQLTDNAGKASYRMPIPNDAAFVGLGLFMSAVTVDTSRPFHVGSISNEQFFRITM